jgi:hypothetical protein
MKMDETKTLDFRSFRPNSVGEYRFEANAYLLGDEELANNSYPWLGQHAYHFTVAPEIEAEALAIIAPNNKDEFGANVDIFVGRPVSPQARFGNNGITDISDAPVNLIIRSLPDMTILYNENAIIPDIPQGMSNNKSDYNFSEFIPSRAGNYQVIATINALDDELSSNNSVCDTFKVIDALSGSYTIGPDKNTGDKTSDDLYNSRNFKSIAYALDALYLRGLTGPVAFEFTSNNYIAGDETLNSYSPAIDLRAKIVGVSSVNTITFKPSNALSSARGSVAINLYTAGGVGVIYG